jgi:hypothetical protein
LIGVEAKRWTVQIYITEDGDETRAHAVLTTRDTSRLQGEGEARRNPLDRVVPEVGDEFAASRALEDLAAHLRTTAYRDLKDLVVNLESSKR